MFFFGVLLFVLVFWIFFHILIIFRHYASSESVSKFCVLSILRDFDIFSGFVIAILVLSESMSSLACSLVCFCCYCEFLFYKCVYLNYYEWE